MTGKDKKLSDLLGSMGSVPEKMMLQKPSGNSGKSSIKNHHLQALRMGVLVSRPFEEQWERATRSVLSDPRRIGVRGKT